LNKTSVLGRTVLIKGEVRAAEDLTIDGRVEGPIHCEQHALTVSVEGVIVGDVIARDVTLFGTTTGQMVATEVVDVRAGARVTGHVLTPQFILADGAHFNGRVEPQHVEAALRVARFQQRRKDSA
jgi:cytoskeletal protein CcmA (bactofilin family)